MSFIFFVVEPVAKRSTTSDPKDYAPLMLPVWMTLEIHQYAVYLQAIGDLSNIPEIVALLLLQEVGSICRNSLISPWFVFVYAERRGGVGEEMEIVCREV